jgi:hypothetical protein
MPSPRVQLVVSGKFIALFLIAAALLGGGIYWHNQQLEIQERVEQVQARFKAPPYFVNRGPTVLRSCQHCLEAGKLKPQTTWKVSVPQEIPATEQRWFLAVEDPPTPVTVAGVLMLPLHPALQDNPAFGFDQSHLVLVVYQDLERKARIEQLPLPQPATPPPVDPPKPAVEPESDGEDAAPSEPVTRPSWQAVYAGDWKNLDPPAAALTRLLITSEGDKLQVHAWQKCLPVDCDWGQATVEPSAQHLVIVWIHKDANRRLEIVREHDNGLIASLHTHYFDKVNHADTEIISYLFRSTETP